MFVGRRAELSQLAEAFGRVPVAVVCGVGGVGKSALAGAFAATWTAPVIRTRASGDLAELIDDAGRLVGAARLEVGPLKERARSLAGRIDGDGVLWLVDDLHRLEPRDRRLLLDILGAELRQGRALATSRERIGMDAGGPDHAEVRLSGLDEADARELWRALDELYGASAGFELALARYRGNPFLLRRAHAGNLSDEDPVAESVAALVPDARRVAEALALSEAPLPVSVISALVEGDRGREVLRQLAAAMIVDVHADGTVSMHDLLREVLRETLEPSARTAMHQDLARLLPTCELDPARRAREVCRHLRALDRHEEAARFLLARGSELDKYGAAGELLRGLDAIPHDRRPAEARVALARAARRAFDLSRSFAEHERLLAIAPDPPVELALVHALLALLTGRPEVAEQTLDRDVPAHLRTQVTVVRALVQTFGGERGAAAALLAGELAAAAPASAGSLQQYHAFALWFDGRDDEAYQVLRQLMLTRGTARSSYRSTVLAPTVLVEVASALGRVDEAAAALREAEDAMAGDDDLLLRTYVAGARANAALERGAWTEALAIVRPLCERFADGGHVVGELSMRALEGRALLVLGRRGEALRLLDDAAATARRHHLWGNERHIELSRDSDPLRWFEPGARTSRRPGGAVWGDVATGLRAIAAGDGERVLGEAIARVEASSSELAAALAALGAAVAATVAGELPSAAAHLARARAGPVDEQLLLAMLGHLGSVRLVTSARSWIARDEDVAPACEARICVDGRSHELRVGTVTTSLGRRPMLRRLAHALARRPGEVVSKEALAHAMWSRSYNAVSDPGPLKTNVANLRKLFDGTDTSIEFDEVGYRLTNPEHVVFVEPTPWSRVSPGEL